MSRSSFGSVSESPTRSLGEGGEEKDEAQRSTEEDTGLDSVDCSPDSGLDSGDRSSENGMSEDLITCHIYTSTSLPPGDRVQVTDDSNEEWWKGKSGDKVGFFPANFVQRVRPGERVWRVTQGIHGNRETGHMAVKESQICVGKKEDGNDYLKLSSGKKRGLVPSRLQGCLFAWSQNTLLGNPITTTESEGG
ncbi:hypothetical protein JZ751_028443 [Albula glossodonta]|uniref:SH3 domain-containing protein n=1 Tax=Albula glossodonta TaxID=121402 RepID=A0A8T2NIV0_9TELE|nr:hypothetical protein JZ751_028443 [Albula glossodonta]